MKKPANPSLFLQAAVFSGAMVATGQPALAQEQKRAVLEEVIVTAQRRAESLQDVAISMTVLDQEEIANANMTNMSDLANLTPSLSTNNRFGSENASFSIRGFTKELRTTASVGVYFAEVVAPRGQNIQTSGDGAGPGQLFDLKNVQVLKGPQGTLFGRNTTGGAILIEPNRPTDVFEGYVEVTEGDFGLSQQQAVVNLPLHDRVRLRLGIDKKEREGHLNNTTNIGADELGDADYTAGRLGLLIDITDTIQNYTLVNYLDSETNGQTARLFDCNTEADTTGNPILAQTVPACQRQLEKQRATGQDGFYDLVSTVPGPVTAIEDLRAINKTTWDITSTITLKNILAFTHLETDNTSDVFGTQFTETQATLTPFPIGNIADPKREFSPGVTITAPGFPVTSQDGFIEEFQVQGISFDGRLDWQAGVYFESSEPDGWSGNRAAILLSCELATLPNPNNEFNCNDPLGGLVGAVSEPMVKTKYINRAVYSQATYDFFEWLSATLGARYTWDDTRGETEFTLWKFVGPNQQDPIVSQESASQSSEAPTGLVELQYRPFPNVMTYAKYVRGYRQGSVNMAADQGVQTHDQEKVDTYELGSKISFEWPIPGRFNISFFDNDFTDMQLQTGYVSPNKGPTTAIFNAGSAEIRGVEADATFQLFQGFRLSLAYSRLMTELLEQEDNCAKVAQAGGSFAGATCSPSADVGDSLPFAQDKAYTASINYRLPLPATIGDISIGGTYAFAGESRATASTTSPNDIIPSYEVVNLNAAWKSIMGLPLDLSVFATNVRDKEYATYYSGGFNSLGFDSRQMGLPRMYGARLRYNFGDY